MKRSPSRHDVECAHAMNDVGTLHRLKLVIGEARCRLYDWRHNVSTCGDVAVDNLGVQGVSADHAAPYAPSHPKFLLHLIQGLGIDYSAYNFVDLGSGKGRVL